jgi:molybdopterin converting factor small subunit
MGIQIQLPGTLRRFADGSSNVDVDAITVGDALRALAARFPRLHEHLFSADGELRTFINVYLNSQDVRFMQRTQTAVKSGDVLALLPAIAGG